VYAFDPRGETFAGFFERIAANWRSWREVEEWRSLEGEIHVQAGMDPAGHVSFQVRLAEGAPSRWTAAATVVTEAGQLDRIAAEARDFARVVYPVR
jgi:hypothetical protein